MANETKPEPVITLRGLEIQLVGMAMSLATAIVMGKLDEHFYVNLDTFRKESVGNSELVNQLLIKCALVTEQTGEWHIIPDERMKQNMERYKRGG